jgi:hypothetical protein
MDETFDERLLERNSPGTRPLEKLEKEPVKLVEGKEPEKQLPVHPAGERSAQAPVKLSEQAGDKAAQGHEDLFSLSSEDFLKRLEEMSPEEIQEICSSLEFVSKAKSRASTLKVLGPLVAVPDEPRNWLSIFMWWEARRIIFNLLVGLCGLPVVFVVLGTGMHLRYVAYGVLEYAVMANICFTAGCIAEVFARRWFGEKVKEFAPVAFTLGTAFSVAFTLFCSLIICLICVVSRLF